MKHFKAIKDEATRLQLPKSFANDLNVHDKLFCEQVPEGNPFVWAIHEGGTHVMHPTGEWSGDDLPGCIVDCFGPGVLFYAWDGVGLRRLAGPNEASEFLKAEAITNGWKP